MKRRCVRWSGNYSVQVSLALRRWLMMSQAACLLIAFASVVNLFAQQSPTAEPLRTRARQQKLPSPEKIVGDYLKAVGGKKRWTGIRDATYEWVVIVGDEERGRARTQTKWPASTRTDIVLRDGEINSAANARSAWMRSLDGNLRTLTDAEASAAKLQSTLNASRLVDYKKQNVQARTVALKQAEGEAIYVVEFSKREGARLRYQFGASTKLLLAVIDDARRASVRFGDYRAREAGVRLEPHRVEIKRDGLDTLTLVLQSARYNTGLAENIFDPPSEQSLDIPNLLREVARNQQELDARVSEYTFTRKQIEREINDRGEVKKEKVIIHEVYPVPGGGRVLKLISENGVPLSAERAAKEERRVAEELAKAEREYEKQKRQRAQERAERAKKKGHETGAGEDGDQDLGIAAFLRACEFVSPRRERFHGREAIVFDFRARAGFRPTKREESIITKLAGVVWIDPIDKQVIRLEARLAEGFKIGGGLLASVRSGSAFALEQTRLDDGVWLPRFAQINASAKVFLLAGFNLNATREYSDYKRFSTKSGDAVLDAPVKP